MENQKKARKRILVTGANGAIAPLLVSNLVEKNHDVFCLVRQKPPENLLPNRAKLLIGDLRDKELLKNACENIEIVFHLGAKLHLNNPSENLRAEYHAVNVEATKNLLDYSRPTCEKFLFASTINVYGTSDEQKIFDEESNLNPQGIYAETKAEAEKFVLAEKNGVVLRFAAVYGSRMKGNYPKLLNAVKNGRFVFVGEGKNRRTLIHEKDLVKAVISAMEDSSSKGQVYNVTDGEIHTFREIVEAMSMASGKKIPKIHLPLRLITKMASATESIGKFLRKDLSFGARMLEKLTEDVAVSGEKIKKELGFRADYNLPKGWQTVIKDE